MSIRIAIRLSGNAADCAPALHASRCIAVGHPVQRASDNAAERSGIVERTRDISRGIAVCHCAAGRAGNAAEVICIASQRAQAACPITGIDRLE